MFVHVRTGLLAWRSADIDITSFLLDQTVQAREVIRMIELIYKSHTEGRVVLVQA